MYINRNLNAVDQAEQPLSIAYFSPGWPPDAVPNGIVSYIAAIAEGLHCLGHSTHILAGHITRAIEDENVCDVSASLRDLGLVRRLIDKVRRRIAPTYQRAFQIQREGVLIARLASQRGAKLLEIEESFGLARWVAGRATVPVVVRLHGPWFLNGPLNGATSDASFRDRVREEGRAILTADAVTAPSRDVLEQTRAYYGVALETAQVIPNPTPVVPVDQRWDPAACDPDLILFVGRFDRHKGGDIVLEAFGKIVEAFPRVRLRFVGPDRGLTDETGHHWDLPAYLRARLPMAISSGQVEWLGEQPKSSLSEHRRRATVTVVGSRYENFPLALLEAMSYGCPTVATRTGGIPEIVLDGVHGLLCEPGSPTDLAEKIAALLTDPNRAAALGQCAALRCEQQYSPEAVARQTVAFYRGVIARHGGKAQRSQR